MSCCCGAVGGYCCESCNWHGTPQLMDIYITGFTDDTMNCSIFNGRWTLTGAPAGGYLCNWSSGDANISIKYTHKITIAGLEKLITLSYLPDPNCEITYYMDDDDEVPYCSGRQMYTLLGIGGCDNSCGQMPENIFSSGHTAPFNQCGTCCASGTPNPSAVYCTITSLGGSPNCDCLNGLVLKLTPERGELVGGEWNRQGYVTDPEYINYDGCGGTTRNIFTALDCVIDTATFPCWKMTYFCTSRSGETICDIANNANVCHQTGICNPFHIIWDPVPIIDSSALCECCQGNVRFDFTE